MTAATAFDAVAIGTEIQRRVGVKTSRDEPLARFTTMRVGGPADLFATVHNPFELRALVRFARQRAAIPHVVLGRGSDLVISDRGIRGLVIQDRAEGSRVDGERYTADAGVPMARAATETQKAGLTGLEFGLAIPGTVGGAVWANAGAHDADVAGVLVSARVLDAEGRESIVPRPSSSLAYRDSRFKHAAADGPPELIAGRDVPARGRRPGRDQGPPRRDPPLATGAPAARAAVGRQRLPQSRRRFGRAADRGGRPEGLPHRRRGRLREARQLHRERPEGHGRGCAAGRRPRAGDVVAETSGIELVYEVEFVGDWEGWPWPA